MQVVDSNVLHISIMCSIVIMQDNLENVVMENDSGFLWIPDVTGASCKKRNDTNTNDLRTLAPWTQDHGQHPTGLWTEPDIGPWTNLKQDHGQHPTRDHGQAPDTGPFECKTKNTALIQFSSQYFYVI